MEADEAEEDLCLTDSDKPACGTVQSMIGDTESTERKIVYIQIPFSAMFGSELTSTTDVSPNDSSNYRLIDRVSSRNEIRKRKSYIMSYNKENNPVWVYEILNRSTLENRCKEQMGFEKNKEVNLQCHLAAAANHRWCQEAYHDTFLMSNMVPQNKSLNEGLWSELENYCREKIKENNVRNVHVYTGPVYAIKKQKADPTHFFKVIIVENNNGAVTEPECYLMPNKKPESESKELFEVKIDEIEKESGLTFIEKDDKFNLQLERLVKWTGEDGNGELHSVDIGVRISPPNI